MTRICIPPSLGGGGFVDSAKEVLDKVLLFPVLRLQKRLENVKCES